MDVRILDQELRDALPFLDDWSYLSKGANGIVFAAYDRLLDRRVAIKIWIKINVKDRRDKEKQAVFEAQKLAKLKNDKIITPYFAGYLKSGIVFLVMEYFDSITAKQWITVPPSFVERTRLASGIISITRVLAKEGLLHGDMHLDNILVAAGGETQTSNSGRILAPDFRIVDFGTSQFAGESFSKNRHWRVFSKSISKLLAPLDIDVLHKVPRPNFDEVENLLQWYDDFILAVPWALRAAGVYNSGAWWREKWVRLGGRPQKLREMISAAEIVDVEKYFGLDVD